MNWKGNERLLICFVLNWIVNLNCRFCMTMMVEIKVWKMGSKICDDFSIICLRGGGGVTPKIIRRVALIQPMRE